MLLALLLACTPDPETEKPDKQKPEEQADDTGSDDTGSDDTGVAPTKARWNFLVFMNGDNDLETYVTHDLNELELGGSSEGVNVLVQADRTPGYADDDGDWEGSRRYFISPDEDLENVVSEVVEDLGEVDMGDPTVLAEFVLWAEENYPAERTALVLWDHGDGWAFTGSPARGAVSWDETSGNDLSIAEGELASALQTIEDARGAPLDVIAFDACNMASWEVAHALSDYGSYMVASEATVGGEGLQYGPALKMLANAEDDSPAALAKNLATKAVEQGGEWTYSAADLTQMAALSAALDELAGLLLEREGGVDWFLETRSEARAVDNYYHDWYVDLVDLIALASASEDPDIAAAALAVEQAIPAVVISNNSNEPLTWVGGLTIHTDIEWTDYLEIYADGEGATWAQDTRWDELLLSGAGML